MKIRNGYILMFCFAMLIGCGSIKKRGVHNIMDKPSLPQLPVQRGPLRDTTTPHRLTSDQIRQLVAASYRYNYDKLFAPQFDQILGLTRSQDKTISSLTASMQRLTIMYGDMRERSIRNRDSMQKVIKAYQNQVIIATKERTEAIRDQVASNKQQTASNEKQINNGNKLIQYMAIGIAVLFLAIIGLYSFCFYLHRLIKKQQKGLKYV